jgi:hypothetical protein
MLMPSEVLKEPLFVIVVGAFVCAMTHGTDTMHSRITVNLVLKALLLINGASKYPKSNQGHKKGVF